MRKSFGNQFECRQAWMQGQAQGHCGSVRFADDTLYSYGMPIAQRLPNGQYAVQRKGPSATTNQHIRAVKDVIGWHESLLVEKLGSVQENAEVARKLATEALGFFRRARNPYKRDYHWTFFIGVILDADRYARAMDSEIRFVPQDVSAKETSEAMVYALLLEQNGGKLPRPG